MVYHKVHIVKDPFGTFVPMSQFICLIRNIDYAMDNITLNKTRA